MRRLDLYKRSTHPLTQKVSSLLPGENSPMSPLEPANTLQFLEVTMSIRPTPYEGFSTSNQSIVPSGAWSLSNSTRSGQCRASTYHFFHPSLLTLASYTIGVVNRDDPNDYDIECDVYSPFLQTVYYPTLEANISVNLANYGGATTLNL
jgi:hypothetical protein